MSDGPEDHVPFYATPRQVPRQFVGGLVENQHIKGGPKVMFQQAEREYRDPCEHEGHQKERYSL